MGNAGQRTELHGQRAYERAGYWCFRPTMTRYGDNDIWNLFDIAAFNPKLHEIRFAQVKKNQTQGELSEWCVRARHFARVSGVQVDFLIRHDGEGWRVLKPDPMGTGGSHLVAADLREWDVAPPDDADISGIDEALAMYMRAELPEDDAGV